MNCQWSFISSARSIEMNAMPDFVYTHIFSYRQHHEINIRININVLLIILKPRVETVFL